MDISDLDLNLLRVFQAIHRERTVTRAAARLSLSQPAVSSALARLRRIFGDPLFVRSRRGMEPTARAQQLLEPIESGLSLIRQGLQQHGGFDPARSEATFTLLVSDIGELYYMPLLMQHIRREAPRVRLRVLRLSQGHYAEALESGRADLAIGFLANMRPSFRYRRLFSDNFICLVRTGHPVISGTLRMQQFLEAGHVIKSQTGHLDGMVARAVARLGLRVDVVMSVPHFHAIPEIVAQSDLVAVVPRTLGRITTDSGRTKSLPLPFHMPPIHVGLHWHARCHTDPAHRWLRATLIRLFGEAPGRFRIPSPAGNSSARPARNGAGRRRAMVTP